MPVNLRRRSGSRFVDVNEESPIVKQVPFDVLKGHGSDLNRVNYHGSDSSPNSVSDDVKNLSLKEEQRPELLGNSMLPIVHVVVPELPKVELSYFDGEPRGYWKFIRQFETYVASRVTDDSQRLLYLIHYCKGKAKTAIEGCVMMEASSCYKRAREILKRFFGQPHVIARETLEDLFSAVNFEYMDGDQLLNLVIKMENCAMVLEQMNYTSDLNSLVTLERIVRLLPQPMQAQWADWVDKLTEDNREPTFDELTQFIASCARVACSRFGRLANRSRKGHNEKTNCHVQLEQGNSSTMKTKCSMCSYDHAIDKCPQFLALTVQDRWSHAKSKGICFVCLRQGHKVNECKMTRLCKVDSCERRHHPLLHTDSTSNVVNDKPSCPEYRKRVVNHTSKMQALENERRKPYDVEFSDAYSSDKSLSVDDKVAIKIVEGGTRFGNGHFVVSIFWKKNPDMRVDNYEVANRRLQSLKGMLSKDVSLHIKYIKSTESDFTKTYAERVFEIYLQSYYRPRWYLPHRAVLNMKKPDFRVVIDCAAQFAEVPRNDMIYQEPDTTAELMCILLGFRKEAVAIPADVEEMLMQVNVPESDRGASRFLWWQEGDMSREPSEFHMTTHAFGVTSSPFRANFALNKTAQIFSDDYDSYVVDTVKNNFYVDDCLISIPTCDQAKSCVKHISEFKNSSEVVSHDDLKGLSVMMLDGLLCVGGRLRYSDSPNAFKHPVILPSRHLVTEMIIRHCPKEQGHIGRSLEKGYGYVFSCLQTWAVHIEMMCSLITDSFIMALLRCIGRRRKPPEIYSDSASSFVWAVSELRKFVQQSNQQKINSELSARPSSNSMGGVWGRVTKSIPRVLLLNTREQVKQVSLKLRISLCCY
ncbi:unnamed protein product [Schistosoma bovis]|nr:unnamed protein product [Schistosoma bovis]